MLLYNLTGYSDNYSIIPKKSWRQYYRDEQNATVPDSAFFKFKAIITGSNPVDDNTKDDETVVPLK